MKGIDLFCGAGGMSVGAIAAGIDVVLAVDSDWHAARTYAHNHPATRVINDDVRAISNFSKFRPDEECILFGGPPCQGFSTSNQRTRTHANPNNWLFKEFLRAADHLRPDWVVFENVRGIIETHGGSFLESIITGLETLGYRVSYDVLNSLDFGVPQNRSRLFVIGSIGPTVAAFTECRKFPHVSVRDAISDLPKLENGANINWRPYGAEPKSNYAEILRRGSARSPGHLVTKNAKHIVQRYRHIQPGGNWADIPKKLMQNYKDASRCHTGIYRRLEWDKPSVVIGNYRKNMLIHPDQDRGLSVREAARLQSFPDHYEFCGSIGFQQQQVGNAVPPSLAKAVFSSIICEVSYRHKRLAAE